MLAQLGGAVRRARTNRARRCRMTTVTFLLGLCGSGKTHLAKELREATGAEIFEGVEHHKSLPAIVQHLRNGKDCIVEEIAYCDSHTREEIITRLRSLVPEVQIECICFENDLESANWNVVHRTNKGGVEGHLAINRSWHGVYKCPDGAKIRPITRICQSRPTA